MVMYRGRVLETGPVRDVLDHPREPYTRALMAAIPSVHTRLHRLPVPEIGQDLAAPGVLPPAVPGDDAEADKPALIQVRGLVRDFDLSAGGTGKCGSH